MRARSKETGRELTLVKWTAGINETLHPETRPILSKVCFTEQHVPMPHVHNGRDLLVIKDGDWIVDDPDAGFYPMPDALVRDTFEEIGVST